jgi:hypothetical protein
VDRDQICWPTATQVRVGYENGQDAVTFYVGDGCREGCRKAESAIRLVLGDSAVSDVTFNLTIPLPRDRRGFIALRCPDGACGKDFQALPGTGKATSTHTCPYCGKEADADAFRREEDLAAAREVGIESGKEHVIAHVHDLIRQSFSNAFRGSRHGSFRPGAPAPRPRPPRTIVYTP